MDVPVERAGESDDCPWVGGHASIDAKASKSVFECPAMTSTKPV